MFFFVFLEGNARRRRVASECFHVSELYKYTRSSTRSMRFTRSVCVCASNGVMCACVCSQCPFENLYAGNILGVGLRWFLM